MESFYHRFRNVFYGSLEIAGTMPRQLEREFRLDLGELFRRLAQTKSIQELTAVALVYLCTDEGKPNRNNVSRNAVLTYLRKESRDGPRTTEHLAACYRALSAAECTENGIRQWIDEWYSF